MVPGAGRRPGRRRWLLCGQCVLGWLVPTLSWRILWLINLPTGLILVLIGGFIPESPKFLRGRDAEAHAVMARFGIVTRQLAQDEVDGTEVIAHEFRELSAPTAATPWTPLLIGKRAALTVARHRLGSSLHEGRRRPLPKP